LKASSRTRRLAAKCPPATPPLELQMAEVSTSGRERWSNTLAFVFAAIGSAVGLGNFWRFPLIVARYGGGLFFIPYLLSLFLLGIPLLLLELGIGQQFQRNAYDAFAQMNTRFKGVAVSSLLTGSMIVIYYCTVLSYILVFLVYSFTSVDGKLPWADNALFLLTDVSKSQLSDFSAAGLATPGPLVSGITGGLFVAWLFTFLCVMGGPKWVSRVVYVTMPLPVICLIVLLGRSVTLPGASDGLSRYATGLLTIENPLGDWHMWADAMGQIFFSLTLGFGVMPAYGSYNDKKNNVVRNTLIIAISNSLISILAGFCVFAAYGYLANLSGQTVEEVISLSGLTTAFIVFPAIIATLPGGLAAQQFFAVVFFIMLFTLGLDSAFSIVEAVSTCLNDNRKALIPESLDKYFPRQVTSGLLCLFFFLLGLPYVTTNGLWYLDIMDHCMTWMLMFNGFCTVVMAGWFWTSTGKTLPFKDQIPDLATLLKKLTVTDDNKLATAYAYHLKFILPILMLLGVISTYAFDASAGGYGGYPTETLFLGWAFYIFFVFVMIVMAFVPYKPNVDPDVSFSGTKVVNAS